MNAQAALDEDLEGMLAMFFAEARDMLAQIETGLLLLENTPKDHDTIDALFRVAHTIKGSAGMFGMHRVVEFTHEVESVLDLVRNDELTIDVALSNLLLQSADVIGALLTQFENNIVAPDQLGEMDRQAAGVASGLRRYLDAEACAPALPPSAVDAKLASSELDNSWHVSLRFGIDTFRNGIDPVSVITYLGTLGELLQIVTMVDKLPAAEELDPTSCYLGFEIRLRSEATHAQIMAAFDVVAGDCIVHILPPNRRDADFITLMSELPDEKRLGDLLVECGAITRGALEDALSCQRDAAAGLQKQQPIGKILVEQGTVSATVVDAALTRQLHMESRSETSRFVRVPADKLDDLINLVGELVICGANAQLQAENLRAQALIETTEQMSGLVEEIRNGTLALRMVQIGESFSRFRRVVRDTAAELGKEIVLEIEGADTELDKSVVEKIGDPLMHLVRNSMDHGIETPAVRLAAGKPAHGTLRLAAHHDCGHIVIRVSDDGRGLDGDKLLAKARARGLVGASQILTEAEKRNLILLPGFSTAETVTNLSGRGVGMDVVRKNIEALRGNVVLLSEVGVGTTIEIRLPLTLAIIDGFLVRIGKSYYVIPLHSVVECIDAPDERMRANGGWAGHFDLRDMVLPFVELREVFNFKGAAPERRSIVVVRTGDSLAGLVVDQLLGEYQTVIKPLGKLFGRLRGISGSTVMGSGEVALILDVPALVRLTTEQQHTDALTEETCRL